MERESGDVECVSEIIDNRQIDNRIRLSLSNISYLFVYRLFY